MLIRDASAERDAGACAAIYAPYVTDTVISLEEQPPSAGEFANRIAQTMRTHPWLVAQTADEVIGYAYAARHRERAAYRWAADIAVYVDTAHHRRGAGRALYEALFGLLAEQGLRIACAGVTLPNDASVGLHEALGFEAVGVYRRIGFKLGAWRDVGWWQLDLAGKSGGSSTSRGKSGGSSTSRAKSGGWLDLAGQDGPPDEPGPPPRLDDRRGRRT